MTASTDTDTHVPVLLCEAIEALVTNSSGTYLDATYGRGGHSMMILDQLNDKGRLFAIDRDPMAVACARQKFASDERFSIWQSAFSRLADLVDSVEQRGKIAGVLMDLGVSSPQLDDPERGFSFRDDGPLDMRMNPDTGVPASRWLQDHDAAEIASVLKSYGEEKYARRIANAIKRQQTEKPINTTAELAAVVRAAIPRWEKHKDPATRSFQAIRIAVNEELEELSAGLEAAYSVLRKGGRLVVISFHSLEDRIVKRFIRGHVRPMLPARGLPLADPDPTMKNIGKPIYATPAEIAENPRSRSAVLRIAEKL